MNDMRAVDELRRSVRLTGTQEDDASDVDLELFFDDILENPSVDVEWLGVVDGSVSSGFLGSVLVFEIPVPFEFLCRWLFLTPWSARHERRMGKRRDRCGWQREG